MAAKTKKGQPLNQSEGSQAIREALKVTTALGGAAYALSHLADEEIETEESERPGQRLSSENDQTNDENLFDNSSQSADSVSNTYAGSVSHIKKRLITDTDRKAAPVDNILLESPNEQSEITKWISFLAEKYGVKVESVNSDKEFYSKGTLTRTIQENTYFISKENPQSTAAVTGYLIDYKKIKEALLLSEPNETVHDTVDLKERAKLLLDVANAKRVEQTSQTSMELGKKIAEIETEFKELHGGKNPSLNKIAEILSTRKIPTPGGKTKWEAVTVKRIIDRNDRQK